MRNYMVADPKTIPLVITNLALGIFVLPGVGLILFGLLWNLLGHERNSSVSVPPDV